MKSKNPFLAKNSRLLLLAALCLGFSFTAPGFLTIDNLSNIVTQQAPFLALLSFGMTMAIILGGIDLSMGANMALCSCVGGLVIKQIGNIPLGIIAALATGLIFGVINGLLITKVKLPSFIATYGMDWIIKGIAYVILPGGTVYGFSKSFRIIATGSFFGIKNLLWFLIIISGFLYFLLNQTTFGRSVYSVGYNIKASKLSGIRSGRIIAIVYGMNGILAALTGLLYAARLDAAEPGLSEGWSLKLIAAALIGGASMGGGKGGIRQTIIGVLIMTVLANGLNLLGISSLWQQAAVGGIIFLSILLEKASQSLLLFQVYNYLKQ